MRRRPAGARLGSFTGLSLRSLRARPLRSLLTASAIALGVGMVFGVLLLVGTIHGTFDRMYDSIYGRTDVVVSGEQSVGSLPETTIDHVRAVPGVESAEGNVWSIFRLVDADGTVQRAQSAQLYTVGVDPRGDETTTAELTAGREPVAGRNEIQLQAGWADKHDLAVGERVRMSTPTGLVTFRVSGLYEFEGGLDLGGYGTASMPVQDARPIMDKRGVWDEIDVVAADGVNPSALRAQLDAALGRGVEVATPQAKGDEVQDQLASLDIVLYFFSGIALFVGAFLILNAFNMTVFQRMREIGTLRALGAGRRRVARGILLEAVLLALAGSVAGLALGAGLAVLLVQAMQSFGLPVSTVDFFAGAAVAAVITGVLATLAGAAWPAVRAGRIVPIQALIGGGPRPNALSPRRAILGLVLFVPSTVVSGLFWFGTNADSPLVGIGATVTTAVMFLGMVLLAPFVVVPLVRLLARPLRAVMPAEGRLAADALRANPGRTAATAATLLVALSVVVVNATVASSFVGSVQDELDARLARDLTVQPLGYQEFGPPQAGLSELVRREIAALPEAGAVARRRSVYLRELPGGGGEGLLVGYDPAEYDRVDRVQYTGAPPRAVLDGLANGDVVVAEPYAKDAGLRVGDQLKLEGPSGVREVTVAGLADTLEGGGGRELIMSLETMATVYGIRNDSQLVIKAATPEQRDALSRKVDALLAREHPGLEALSNAEVKQEATDAINQQFGLFNAIVGVAVLVGMLGIVNTLTMSVLERTREIGVLRALGASRWRVRRTMADESLLISLAGTLSGVFAGLLIGVLWVLGMRATTFEGMAVHLPLTTMATIALLGVVIGVVASLLPARRAARLDPLAALRYE